MSPPNPPPLTAAGVPLASGCELVLGGQKSGKSRHAESLCQHWLAQDPAHEAGLLVTAQALDAEMADRIQRHRAQRARLAYPVAVQEVGTDLTPALRALSAPHRLLVVDCLTLWMTGLCMPPEPSTAPTEADLQTRVHDLIEALAHAPGPVVCVANEVGQGVTPLGAQARAAVDALGLLNQRVADISRRVVWMVAGIAVTVKGAP